MKVGYDHELLSSFYLWFNDRMTYFAEAYIGPTEHNFVYVDSHDIPENYLAYYSPYRQFVAASDKFEQPVDNYVFIDGDQVFDKDGIYIDYDQGRVLLLKEKFGNKQNLDVVGFFAVKTINTYITDDTEEDVILNKETPLAYRKRTQVGKKVQLDKPKTVKEWQQGKIIHYLDESNLKDMKIRLEITKQNIKQ